GFSPFKACMCSSYMTNERFIPVNIAQETQHHKVSGIGTQIPNVREYKSQPKKRKDRNMSQLKASMQGKICMITGANSGIGKSTALGLARMGDKIIMVCRDRANGEEAQNEIKTTSGNTAVDLMLADLSSQQSIRELVENVQQRYPQLHVLINNAGVAMLSRKETVDGLEMTFAVNYLAPFLLT